MDGSKMDPEVAISALAASMLEKHGDLSAAAKALEDQVHKDRGLFHALMKPLVGQACYDAVRKIVRGNRQDVWTAANYTPAGNGQRLKSMATTLLDFPLPTTSQPIRDAGKDDLIASAEFYEAQAQNMGHKGRWLRLVADKVGRKTVGAKFSAEQLQAMMEAAK